MPGPSLFIRQNCPIATPANDGLMSAGQANQLANGGGGQGLPDPTTFPNGSVPVVRNGVWVFGTQLTVNDILPAFAITGFAGGAGYSAVLELGATMINPSFSASYNETPSSATINDGSGAVSLTTPFTSYTYAKTYTETTVGSEIVFTLNATSGGNAASPAAVVTAWDPRCYFGAADDPGTYTSSFITSLASNALAGGRQRSISTTTGAGQYVFYGYDTSFGGTPSDFIDASTGFAFGVSLVATVNVTNGFGVVVPIGLWRSQFPNLGATTMVVE